MKAGHTFVWLLVDAVLDDYLQQDVCRAGDASQLAAERFFDLCGLRVSMKEKKRLPLQLCSLYSESSGPQ